jgi:lysozyme family protein
VRVADITGVSQAFLAALAKTLGWEGGFSDSPIDRGGPTKWGITQKTYDRWRLKTGQVTRPVWQATEREMALIYHDFFWTPVQADKMPRALGAAVFDMAVHSGEGDAVLALQRAAGFKGRDVDGKLGPKTLAAAQHVSVLAYLKERGAHIQEVIADDPPQVGNLEG